MAIYLFSILTGAVIVQCCQTNKRHTIKVKDLHREDGETLTTDYMVKGADLIMAYKGKPYEVQFIQFKGTLVDMLLNDYIYVMSFTRQWREKKVARVW